MSPTSPRFHSHRLQAVHTAAGAISMEIINQSHLIYSLKPLNSLSGTSSKICSPSLSLQICMEPNPIHLLDPIFHSDAYITLSHLQPTPEPHPKRPPPNHPLSLSCSLSEAYLSPFLINTHTHQLQTLFITVSPLPRNLPGTKKVLSKRFVEGM